VKNHHTEEGANDVVDKPTNEDEEGKSLLHGVKLDLDDRAIVRSGGELPLKEPIKLML
jgi:hypothetical protein